MIHSVTANKESFHSVTFQEGLNLIVAERSQNASDTDSRNGLGKSTLFRIIDFCLGSDVNKKGTLPAKYLPEWEFTLDLDLRQQRILVTRATDDEKVVRISGDVSGWPIPPTSTPGDNLSIYSVKDWKSILGWALFDLPNVGGEAESLSMPSERSLLYFFIRKGFEDPLQPIGISKTDSLSIAYLLGLNWEYLSRLNDITQREKDAKTVQSAAKLQLKEWEKTERALRTECNALNTDLTRISEQLGQFNVLPGYEEIEKKVNALTAEIHELKNHVITEQSRLSTAKRQLDRARAALNPVEDIYAEVGMVFPDAVKETLQNVKTFHEEVTGSRRIILEREVRALAESIKAENARIRAKSEERREAMQILQTHNALGEYTLMTQRYAEKSRELERKLDCLRHLQESKANLAQLKEEKVEVADEAREEYEATRPVWDESERYFKELTEEFYGTPGSLNIAMTSQGKKWGFKFDPRVDSDDSEGIKKIKVFAFDATVFHQQRVCQHPIDFLIHDSVVYDSTDPRQVAKALLAADRISRALGGQYICAINSDKLQEEEFTRLMPPEQSRQFVRLTLSDESDATKLLGISFGRATTVPTIHVVDGGEAVPFADAAERSAEPPRERLERDPAELPPPDDAPNA